MIDPWGVLSLGFAMVMFVCGLTIELPRPIVQEIVMAESTLGHDTLTTLATAASDAKAKVAIVETLRTQLAAAIGEANSAIDKQEAAHKAHVDTITSAFPLPAKVA